MPFPARSLSADRRLNHPAAFRQHVCRSLALQSEPPVGDGTAVAETKGQSVVLLPIGPGRSHAGRTPQPCMILNKRSQKVRQPGDICCPGGGIEPRIDALLSGLLRLPGSPLRRWAYYSRWRRRRGQELDRLRLLLATALREGLEEMRLNPLRVRFLGTLPPESLVMFRRVIHPLVIWVDGQRRFHPNWEVERVVRIPLRQFLNPERYICCRLTMPTARESDSETRRLDFPALRFLTPQGTEILWGATFRITMAFMHQVFDFRPPGLETLEVVERQLPPHYLKGTG
jgi:hypothetical protein